MPVTIQTNEAALIAQQNMLCSMIQESPPLSKRSSGCRMTNTCEDAAGLGISEDLRIRDVSVALETSNLTKSQIMLQAENSVLAQANSVKQGALSFLVKQRNRDLGSGKNDCEQSTLAGAVIGS